MLKNIKKKFKKQDEIKELLEEIAVEQFDETDILIEAVENNLEDEYLKEKCKTASVDDNVDLSTNGSDVINEKEPKKIGGDGV